MHVIYALQEFPLKVQRTLFLAGCTPRTEGGVSWRKEALEILQELGFEGEVFVPEPPEAQWAEDYSDQVEWEEEGLRRADVILFWVPRDIEGKQAGEPLLGLTTNDEWGVWKDSGKVVWGNPAGADHTRYQRYYCRKLGVPQSDTLRGTIEAALAKLGEGAVREGGEASVPLHVWTRPDFQAWYRAQRDMGNTLNSMAIPWSLWVGKGKSICPLYVLHPSVQVGAEDRAKANECVVVRPDISVVCLYRRHPDRGRTQVVLVKEFRSAARTQDAYVHELPGGSSSDPKRSPLAVAQEETSEELGFEIAQERLVSHGSRQMGATLASYHAHLFSAELTDAEIDRFAKDTSVHGADSEERVTIEVKDLDTIMSERLVDWPTLGQILQVIR